VLKACDACRHEPVIVQCTDSVVFPRKRTRIATITYGPTGSEISESESSRDIKFPGHFPPEEEENASERKFQGANWTAIGAKRLRIARTTTAINL